MPTVVYTTTTGVPTPTEHARIIARIHAAPPPHPLIVWVRCRMCGHEKQQYLPCPWCEGE